MLHNAADFDLYNAANSALDKHIALIGKVHFASDLKTFDALQQAANDACSSLTAAKQTVGDVDYNPRRDCHWQDNGCAVTCLERWFNSAFGANATDEHLIARLAKLQG